MSGALHVRNLSKSYRQWGSEWRRVASWFAPFIHPREEHWVLKDVNFSVSPGEAVGIVGQNGAGKSTLLKLITGTTCPTQGEVQLFGRVAAILELGMGFNPDLTGRENAYHAAGLMGHSQTVIKQAMPDIEAFAEVGEYFDQPLRTYSSGMQMRVTFSVATAFKPDLLIVDEALAVGDVYFQQKCFERINSFISSGTTLLFVSHSMDAVLNICSRAILIRQGRIVHDGSPQDVIDIYQADLLMSLDKTPLQFKVTQHCDVEASDTFVKTDTKPTVDRVPRGKTGSIHTDCVTCTGVRFLDHNGRKSNALVSDTEVTLEIDYLVNSYVEDPHIGFKIKNRYGVVLFETNTYCMGKSIGPTGPHSNLNVRFTFPLNLMADEYSITLGFGNSGFGEGSFEQVLGYLHEASIFTVLPNLKSIKWAGLINLRPTLEFKKTPSGA